MCQMIYSVKCRNVGSSHIIENKQEQMCRFCKLQSLEYVTYLIVCFSPTKLDLSFITMAEHVSLFGHRVNQIPM